jgi:hypothetical protein
MTPSKGEVEVPAREKLGHDAVGYENHSSHPGQTCGNCSMYIGAMLPRCTIVVRPIYRGGWCRRWAPRKRGGE